MNNQELAAQLRIAVADSDTGRVETLINQIKNVREDINAAGLNSRTALHLAAQSANDVIISLLLQAGADPTLKDNNGKTALNYYLSAVSITHTAGNVDKVLNNLDPTTKEALIKVYIKKYFEKGNKIGTYYYVGPDIEMEFLDNVNELRYLSLKNYLSRWSIALTLKDLPELNSRLNDLVNLKEELAGQPSNLEQVLNEMPDLKNKLKEMLLVPDSSDIVPELCMQLLVQLQQSLPSQRYTR